MRYVILANSSVGFDIPKQLSKINGEELTRRTIRLLKENNVKDILISSKDKRFDNLGATRYEPLYNNYIPNKQGYWVDAFPIELLNEPICFLFGDVYYSENAIKTIVETSAEKTLFFCSYQNTSSKYIKPHDEPLGYKVVDYELFKKHIQIVKDFKDSGKAFREPLVWELYRSINNQPITEHYMTTNYVAINDESCDIDTINDIMKLSIVLGGKFMIRLEATRDFTLKDFNKIKIIKRKHADKNEKGYIYNEDVFECDEEMSKYLTGGNEKKLVVAKILEIIPEVSIVSQSPVEELKKETETKVDTAEYKTTKRTTKKKNNKKRVEF